MPIYDRPIGSLMLDMIDTLAPGPDDVFTRQQALAWFQEHYPKIKEPSISAGLIAKSVNLPSRVHYHASDRDDVLIQVGSGRYRRYNPATDPHPIRRTVDPIPGMPDAATLKSILLPIMRHAYPRWQGFDDKRFTKEEIDYKQVAIEAAKSWLSESDLRGLQKEGRYDEIFERLENTGKKCGNLLFNNVPMQGDLRAIHQGRSQPAFYDAVIDLLYGEGDSPERLERYTSAIEPLGVANYWTFPTYFLFVVHPESELFIKPKAIGKFLKLIGRHETLPSKANAADYRMMLDLCGLVREAFAEYDPGDMVDIQSLIWVCANTDMNVPPALSVSSYPVADEGGTSTAARIAEHSNVAFTSTAFELLSTLHDHPVKATYLDRKEEFKVAIEEPFRRILDTVASDLPTPMLELMETRLRVTGNFLKNDYGKGGANDFYWGAFYPKGGKRTENAQLFVWMNRDRLEYGFYIGDNGSVDRHRFEKACKQYQEVLQSVLDPDLTNSTFVFGRRDDFSREDSAGPGSKISYLEWLASPTTHGITVAVVHSRDEIVSMSANKLAFLIANAFIDLYPLALLATLDQPMQALESWINRDEDANPTNDPYTIEACASHTGISIDTLRSWTRAIERKKQAVLYGPPGTGKTFVADHLARHLVGGGDGLIDLVQFHPAYSYEDFILGIRPESTNGTLAYPMVEGRFLQFCNEARRRSGISVMIIDEINRANLARVFGELMYLLEYRDKEITLAGGRRVSIPDKVRIIGTMNTADRSIALVDHALRRRFAFLELEPQYDALLQFHGNAEIATRLVSVLQSLNKTINDSHYLVGTSFFMVDDLAGALPDIWEMEIVPYLREYFFDQQSTVDKYRWKSVESDVV